MGIRESLHRHVRECTDAAAARWLDDATPRAATGSRDELLALYTAASRKLGTAPLGLADDAPFGDAWSGVPLDRWTLEDAGRTLLLLARHDAAASPDAGAADAVACYEQGDAREQQSWLRGVALLPEPARHLPLVIDACRTNILPVFEAVACENPYPARYFPERNFNQVVLKALFNGVALARIAGLAARANPELARMATDYAAERRAAGRSIPADIALATTPAAAQKAD
jgi:hypothetical protein